MSRGVYMLNFVQYWNCTASTAKKRRKIMYGWEKQTSERRNTSTNVDKVREAYIFVQNLAWTLYGHGVQSALQKVYPMFYIFWLPCYCWWSLLIIIEERFFSVYKLSVSVMQNFFWHFPYSYLALISGKKLVREHNLMTVCWFFQGWSIYWLICLFDLFINLFFYIFIYLFICSWFFICFVIYFFSTHSTQF